MKILRLVNVHNEEDILQYNLEWYINQGIETIAIDNNSSDNSYNILKSYVGKGILEIKKIITNHFDRCLLFDEISKLAHNYKPDWIIFADCDEFYEPENSKFNTISELIQNVDLTKDNLIQFHNIEFWMTPDDDYSIENPIQRIKHYSYFDSNRFKAFKFYEGFSLVPNRGHAPTFPGNIPVKLSKHKGISRHYKFRSLDQGEYKISRVIPEPNKKDFGFHYAKFKNSPEWFIINPNKLNKYNDDRVWSLEKKFNGNRMTNSELIDYLGLSSLSELNEWFDSRKGVKK